MSYLRDLVIAKISELGSDEAAAEFFAVSPGLVGQWRTGSKSPSLAAVERVFDPEKLPGAGKVEEANWEGKKVAVLLPFYKSVAPQTALSLLHIIDRAKMLVLMRWNDAYVAHSRDTLAAHFLRTEAEFSWWVDDDVVMPSGSANRFRALTGWSSLPDKFAGIHTLNQLMSRGKTLIGGVYFGRSPQGKPLYAEGAASLPERQKLRSVGPRDEVRPTKWIATGCLLAHRRVYQDIEKTFPHLAGKWFSPSEQDVVSRVKESLAVLNDAGASEQSRLLKVRALLERGLTQSDNNSKLGTGEDITFSYRAAAAGHQPHVDLSVMCAHIGPHGFGPYNTSG